MLKSFLSNLLSRKFILAVVQIVAGLLLVFGFSDNSVAVISGAALSLLSTVAYIYTEGKIDAAAVGVTIEDVLEAIEVLQDELYPEPENIETTIE